MQNQRQSLQYKSLLFVPVVFIICCAWKGPSLFFAESNTPESADRALSSAEAQVREEEYQRLYDFLAGYLQNDLELQKLSVTAQSKKLSLKSSKIDNGTALELSSGTMKIYTSEHKTKVTMEPELSLSLPALNDTSLSADIPLTIADGEKTVSDGELSISTGIISGKAKSRKVSILEAERALLEAERAVQDRALNAEKDFYTQLKKLYGYAVSVIEEKNDLYEDDEDLRTLVAQGYGESSSKYRQAYMDVQSDIHDTVQAQRRLERETSFFARKCGIPYNGKQLDINSSLKDIEEAYQIAVAFLPSVIPQVEGVDVLSFPKESYSETESAVWDKHIASLSREADYAVTLKATGSYTLNDSTVSSDTAGGGLSLVWHGLSASAGLALPTGSKILPDGKGISKEKYPIYTFSIGFSPNTFRNAKLEREQDKLDAQLEDIAIKSAEDDYESDVLEQQLSLRDLIWARHSYSENFDMYAKLEKDMAQWYQQGLITEFDYIDTRDNRDLSALNLLINASEFIIYNNETKLLFHTDSELQGVDAK